MAVTLLFVGRTKEGFVREGVDKYVRLASRYVKLEVRETRAVKGAEPRRAVEEEADAILKDVSASDYVVALDERGVNPGSVEFARELERLMGTGRRLVFVVGGPFGLSGRVRARADMLLSLSRMTLTHEMARLALAEQLYRAMTIIKGKAYHY